jgi:phage gp29-like protein
MGFVHNALVAADVSLRAFAAKLSTSLTKVSLASADLPLTLQSLYVPGSLSPDYIATVIREADVGRPYRLVSVGNKFRQQDGHLHSVLQTREKAVAKLPWQVVPANGKRRSIKIARFVEGCLTQFGRGYSAVDGNIGFHDLLVHLMGSVFFGYAVSELMWERRSELGGIRLIPVCARPINQRRFIFDEMTGRLHWFDITSPLVEYPGIDLAKEPAGKFIVAAPRINGDLPSREGLIRLMVWLAYFRNWAVRDMLKLAELAWKPRRIGYYTKGADKKDILILIKTMKELVTQGVAMLPDSVRVDVEWPKGQDGTTAVGNNKHLGLSDYFAKEMSKAGLGQTMTTEDGSSMSQAKVHDEVRKDIRDSDANFIADLIQSGLVAPLVAMNFGDVEMPRFVFVPDDAVDILRHAQAILAYKTAGLRIVEQDVRAVAGFSEPQPGDVLLGGEVVAEPEDSSNARKRSEYIAMWTTGGTLAVPASWYSGARVRASHRARLATHQRVAVVPAMAA